MTRGRKILVTVAVCFAGLIVTALMAGLLIARTQWFRNMVREKIVAAVEEATGGKVDIASFSFDWTHLRAQVRGFVIHGLEPPSAAPLFRAKLVEVDLKLLSPFRGFVDIAYLLVDSPEADIIVDADGRTNIPAPKIKPKSNNKTGLETVVDLAIGRFDIRNGGLTFADRKADLNCSGADLRAQVGYNAAATSYKGELDISPLYFKSGGNPALNLDVKLPFTMEKDKISLSAARFSTVQSLVLVSGSMEHLIAPRTTAHVNARVDLNEVAKALGVGASLDTQRGPHLLTADVSASMDENAIQVQTANASLGHSDIQASGSLRNAAGAGSVQFNSTLALGEIGKLLRVPARPEGTLKAAGRGSLDANNQYKVTGQLDARGVAFRQGSMKITGVSLNSAVFADSHRIQLSNLQLAVLGGSFGGSAGIEDMKQFQVAGSLHNFDIDKVTRLFQPGGLGYGGVISGPVQADGDLKDIAALVAKASLAISPASPGIPVSGHIGLDYDGRANTVILDRTHLALPHTTADLTGSLGKQIQVHLLSRNFSDFAPIAQIPVTFSGDGAAAIDANVTGSLSAPRITGLVSVSRFNVRGRAFTSLTASLDATNASAAVINGVLSSGPLRAEFSASAGLHNWKPETIDPLKADLVIRSGDLRDVLALADRADLPATGGLNADAHIGGTVGSPTGTATLSVTHGTLESEPFDSFTVRATMNQTAIDIPGLSMVAGPSRLDANAHYQHPVNDLQRGTLTAHVASNQVQLAQFQSLIKDRPGLRGLLNLNADATATMAPAASGTDVELTGLNATATARNLEMEGKSLGDFTVTAASAGGSDVQYNVSSNFAGSTIRVTGKSALSADHQTTASANIANLPIDRVLAIAGLSDVPLKGTLTTNAELSGTLAKPTGNATVTIANGSAYGQPFTSLQTSIRYTDVLVDISSLHLSDGPANLDLTASFDHPAGDLEDGELRFHTSSGQMQLSRIHTVAVSRPGLDGILQLTADGSAALHRNAPPTVSSLNAKVSARNLSQDRQPLGDFNAAARSSGNAIDFNLNSNFAKARIDGSGRLGLAAGYPIDAKLTLSDVTWSSLRGLLGAPVEPFDASLAGEVTVTGSTAATENLRGTLQLTKLEAHAVGSAAGKKQRVKFELHNTGNIQVSLANSLVTVQSFQLNGPYSNLAISGSGSIKSPGSLNLKANGNIKLEMLEAFDSDISSAGAVTLNAAVTGTSSQPVINWRLQLQNASFNLLSLPNGLSNANGAIDFNGTEAVIDNLTGETGGGKLTLAGLFSYGGPHTQFRIQATASKVHVDYPDSVTTEANATLVLTGNAERSMLTGNVVVESVALHSSSDVGSILSSATPPSSSSASTGIMAGMHFDVRIRTSPGVQFRSTLSQNLQAEADLALRGTPDHPGMIGRVVVDSGDMQFFGAKYTVNQGTVSFTDPNKINPSVNLDLETTVQGVDVTITVTGRMDKLKLAYRSDPPLEFQQIVSLLAAGKTPTTDPVIAAHQPPAPQQNAEQAGVSAVLGQAVGNPVSGRLQRLFGVTKLSINPQILGDTSNNPQATLTLQQQVTSNITFTYMQDVSESNPSAIRIEWAINPRFSAIAQRDVYGEFALDFFYKKRFH